jgi:voltage-gated potassium channel
MGLDAGIEQVNVVRGSAFADRALSEMHTRRELGVIVLAIRRANGEMLFNPPGESRVAGGDHLIVIGGQEGLRKLERLTTEVMA